MNFKQLFGEEWYEALEHILQSQYWERLGAVIAKERLEKTVYPDKNSDLLFKAFRTTPLSKIKVVILGQDPYHDGSYDGFAFSNTIKTTTRRISPSLVNILHEVHDDIYTGSDDFGEWLMESQEYVTDLERWAQQGVLLINTAHTVVRGTPGSHAALWKPFTIEVMKTLCRLNKPTVWILWGNHAKRIAQEIAPYANEFHKSEIKLIQSAHPSPFSAYQGFFGSKPFSRTNEFLKENKIETINW